MAMTAPAMPGSPTALLADLVRRAPARPFVTYYDLAADARTELSVVTFTTWVAKTVGLLTDELGVGPGDRVSLVLPAHWLGLVWPMAVWSVGGVVVLAPDPAAVLQVRSADELDPASPTESLVVLSTLPLGGPVGAATPHGAMDYGREVLSQPDELGPTPDASPRDPADPLAVLLTDAASRLEDRNGARVVVASSRTTVAVLRDALLVPLLGDGSTVLVAGAGDQPGAEHLSAIAAAERAVIPSFGAASQPQA